MKRPVATDEQKRASHKHAKHLAELCLHTKNARGAADAFKSIDPLVALEFFYQWAHDSRLSGKHDHALVALEAADLIMRVDLSTQKETTENKNRPLRSSRLIPSEIFAVEIEENL